MDYKEKTEAMMKNRNDEIAIIAYELYCQRGYQNGDALGDWLEAERIVSAKYNTPIGNTPISASKQTVLSETENPASKKQKGVSKGAVAKPATREKMKKNTTKPSAAKKRNK